MRTSADDGWIELLYNIVGNGTRLLATRQPGEELSLLGPIGTPFELHKERPRPLLIGGGVGMPPMIFLAQELRDKNAFQPLVMLGSEVEFPFASATASIQLPGLPQEATAAMPLLEEWGVPNRLASQQNFEGCFQGFITDLARHWLDSLDQKRRGEVEIFACGPHPMLEAVAAIALEHEIPCQVSLEEFMACGVGACAGCVVEVKDESGTNMQRVCVDGPVFAAEQIFP
jgi:dihydroorotate dehydrogenase electron transfer subunit